MRVAVGERNELLRQSDELIGAHRETLRQPDIAIGEGNEFNQKRAHGEGRLSPFFWRSILIYILPALGIAYVVLSWLWLVPDTLIGMYGNHDGQWASWNARGILEWGRFLDFSPFSPLVGTGSLFLPNLPWLNPGALALATPVSLPVRHLLSMLIYFVELSASLYLLYRNLEFSRAQSFVATILYFCIVVVPVWAQVQPWFSLAPVNAHSLQ
jgi:hypothetical protein